jgi:hypothetical protein
LVIHMARSQFAVDLLGVHESHSRLNALLYVRTPVCREVVPPQFQQLPLKLGRHERPIRRGMNPDISVIRGSVINHPGNTVVPGGGIPFQAANGVLRDIILAG